MKLLSSCFLFAISSAEEVVIGTTYEGRSILANKITSQVPNAPHVVVECGSQGNDWNSAAFCESLVDYVESSSESSPVAQVQWTIVSKLNPDGYEYSKNSDSSWRKNRRTNEYCNGVNIAHNFPVHFVNPPDQTQCSQIFSGSEAVSEEETKALVSINEFDAFFSVMDVGDKIVYPFTSGYLDNEHEDLETVKSAAQGIARMMSTSSGDRFEAVEAKDYEPTRHSGSILDWAYTKTNFAFGLFLDDKNLPWNPPQPVQQLKLISAIEDFASKYLANRPVVKKADDSGGWRGIFDGPNVEVYRKIAYAEAPIGDLRFRLPVEKNNLTKISNNEGSVACIQSNKLVPIEIQSEDCLYLNIYRPANASNPDVLPVLIFNHGGGLAAGYGDFPPWQPTNWIENFPELIVVNFNYRLNSFGYLGLDVENEDGVHGNFGVHDQNKAIKWVYDNIHYFGGDKEQITLMGQSAGGQSVFTHAQEWFSSMILFQ